MNQVMYKNINGVNTVTFYGLCCGYGQGIETDNLDKKLFKEHNTYHVQSTKNNTPQLNTKFDGPTSHKYIVWESFERLTDARRFYNKLK